DVLDLASLDSEDFPLRIDWGWGNDLVGARWVHPHRRGGALTVSASFTRFRSGLRFPDFGDTDLRSDIDEATVEVAADLLPTPGLRLTAGARTDHYAYDNLAQSGGTVFSRGRGSGWQLSTFGQAEWRVASRWLVEAGLRVDGWRPGSGPALTVLSPRLAVKRFLGGSHWAIKAAGGRYAQFVHSLRDEELPLGLDTWVLAGERAPHLVSDQLQLGVEGYPGEAWEVSLEAFARDFDGVAAFSTADDPNDPTDDVLAGDGRSWGADLFVRRLTGEVTGSLALSWLRAERTFPDILSPLEPRPEVSYPPVFDRRIDLDLVLRFPLPRGWMGGLRWNLGTGLPYTRPVGSYAHYQPR
ncbi:MAG TPA: TonB-dependent receptor, partial [Longimicrobiales bacterium]|nr:TonB-dependent receptor [Longimicrobiales bacterium]